MWRAIRIPDGKVLFEDRDRTRVQGWIRRMKFEFYTTIDRVPSTEPAPMVRYFG